MLRIHSGLLIALAILLSVGAAPPLRLTAARASGGPGPGLLCCGGGQVTGLYAYFSSTSLVNSAVNKGWQVIGDVAGQGTTSSPYTTSTGQDQNVYNSCRQNNCNFVWLSFWTVSGPTGGDTWYSAGYKAGQTAATTLKNVANGSGIVPNYVILDAQGYNGVPSSASQWSNFVNGWRDGIASVSIPLATLTAAFYANQSQYSSYNLGSLSEPAFIAVSPILNNKPTVSGPNLTGWDVYYAYCDSPDGSASKYVNQVNSWGGESPNTVQFSDSGVDCGPS
jgi:hypothetical protein